MGIPRPGQYHRGELEVQRRAGVEAGARRAAQGIHRDIPPAAREFLARQPMAVVASVADDGGVWASLLTGPPGFLAAIDDTTVRLGAAPAPGDPLAESLLAGADIGLLAIDLANRRRMRINGIVEVGDGGAVHLRTHQVYGNCPKYIQARVLQREGGGAAFAAATSTMGERLTPSQRLWLARADTFFIASHHHGGGADASHRGGMPGFVTTPDAQRVVWPDYSGNQMFQTLGNLTANPRAGLLFVDFERGTTLQLTGAATVDWDAGRAASFPGAERVVELRVARWIESAYASPLRWRLVDYSPFNPPPPPRPTST